jgi:hypothetical protein
MQLYPKDALPIHRPEALLSAEPIGSQENEAYLLYRRSVAKNTVSRKIARLIPVGDISRTSKYDLRSMKKLTRVMQMSPSQIQTGIETMLTLAETFAIDATPIDSLQSFRFERAIGLSGAFIAAKSTRQLREQRTRTANWMTRIIQAQPIALFITATNEDSGAMPESIQSYGARLVGFEHAEYDSTMFYEPIVESATGKRGLLPLGFRPRAGIFAEVN